MKRLVSKNDYPLKRKKPGGGKSLELIIGRRAVNQERFTEVQLQEEAGVGCLGVRRESPTNTDFSLSNTLALKGQGSSVPGQAGSKIQNRGYIWVPGEVGELKSVDGRLRSPWDILKPKALATANCGHADSPTGTPGPGVWDDPHSQRGRQGRETKSLFQSHSTR